MKRVVDSPLMPPGSRLVGHRPADAGSSAVELDYEVPGTPAEVVRHAQALWPSHGWPIIMTDSEFGEAEVSFASPRWFGLIRVTEPWCGTKSTKVTVLMEPRPPAPA